MYCYKFRTFNHISFSCVNLRLEDNLRLALNCIKTIDIIACISYMKPQTIKSVLSISVSDVVSSFMCLLSARQYTASSYVKIFIFCFHITMVNTLFIAICLLSTLGSTLCRPSHRTVVFRTQVGNRMTILTNGESNEVKNSNPAIFLKQVSFSGKSRTRRSTGNRFFRLCILRSRNRRRCLRVRRFGMWHYSGDGNV